MSGGSLFALQDAWRLAMQREQDAFDFYTKMAHGTADASLKVLFAELSEQEAEHKARLVREYRRVFEADMEEPRQPTGIFHRQLRGKEDGPVAWMDWTEDTFRLAQELDLPVLLDISAVWCHWCHVMDHLTYENPDVASLVNAEFIPIRVDNDRRPDINARYNMGGWPTTAVLSPGGEVLTGRTYVPPDEMTRFLKQVSEYYRANRDELGERLQQAEQRRRDFGHKAQAAGPASLEVVDAVASSILESFDRIHGGFGDAPKFPHPDALELALALYHRTGDGYIRRLLELTLTNMATGGMYDHEMGGFFRYSTTKDWTVPHFEKMSEDNAKLLRLYLHAFQVFGKDFYQQVARQTVEYINDTLYDQALGFFYGSQDADEQYYNLSLEERKDTTAPYVDKTAYTNWNCMMAMAYFEASVILGEPMYTRQATQALDYLWDNAHQAGMGMFHYVDRVAQVPGLLTDQAWMTRALLHSYQYTGRRDHLAQAITLAHESIYAHYADPEGAGYLDCVVDPLAAGRLKEGIKNLDENALVADISTLLYRLTGDEHYRQAADSALTAFGSGYSGYRYFASSYALAAYCALRPPISISVVGTAEDPESVTLLRAALRVYAPNSVTHIIDPVWERDQLEQAGLPSTHAPAVYVCREDICADPVTDPDQVSSAIAMVSASLP